MNASELEQFLSHARNVLQVFENKVKWDKPDLEVEEMAICPYDEKHRVQKNRLQNHVRSCHWRQYGYSKEEIKEIFEQEERTKNEMHSSFVHLDSIIEAVAPGTIQIRSDEKYKCSLNHDHRLAVYNKTVAELYKTERKMPDQALYADLEAKAAEKLYQKENPENLSKLEMLQRIRDMKKRRQSYRAKNVHITKRSQTEIIRGVLEVHMEELRNLWNPELREKEEKRKRDEKLVKYESHHRERSPDRDDRHQGSRYYSRRETSSTDHKTRCKSRVNDLDKSGKKSSKRNMTSESSRDRSRSHKRHKSSPSSRCEKSHKRHEKSSSSKKNKHKREKEMR